LIGKGFAVAVKGFLLYTLPFYLLVRGKKAMMGLLRKYQRVIFSVITVLIIISFAFFGTYGALQDNEEAADRVLGKGIDGSFIYQREISHLAHLFDTEGLDDTQANILNDGIVKNEILKSGIGALLFEKYEEELKEGFQSKVAQFKKFRPYVHPQKMIGVELTWKRFMPSFYDHFVKFKEVEIGDAKGAFTALVDLYLDQAGFSPQLMKQMLFYQQQQYKGIISEDPYLRSGDLSLFHAKSLSDWFGPKYVELLAQFIHNTSLYAELKGYKVSLEEAKASLIQTGMENVRNLDRTQKISREDFQQLFHRQLQYLGMKEKDAVKTWQKVLLFRRMFNDVGYGVLVDSFIYKRFHEYASKSAKLDLYTLPVELQFKTPEDVMGFEIYLDSTMEEKEGLDLFGKMKDIKNIMAETPELVQRRFVLEVASSTREEICSDIGIRQTWDWEVQEENWKVLCAQFPELKESAFVEEAVRSDLLENLSPEIRKNVDRFARNAILDENPGMIRERLSCTESTPRNLAIALKGDREPLVGIKDRSKLLYLLEIAPVRSDNSEGNIEAVEKLTCYTEDGKNFFRIDVIDRAKDYEVMTYKDAIKYQVLEELLESRLRVEYERKAYVGDFEEVRESIGKKIFSHVAKEVLREESSYNAVSTGDVWDLAVKRRLGVFLRRLEEQARSGIKENENGQWDLKKEEIVVSRKNAHELFKEELFDLPEGSWSEVLFDVAKGALFYQVLDRYVEDAPVKEGLQEGRVLLGNEARTLLMKHLIDEFSKKGVITFEIKEVE
jgi:GcvH upstream region-like protein